MKKFKKKLAAIGAAMVMASSCFSIGASAYSLRYTSGATSSDNVLSYTTSVKSTGAQKITVKSTTFTAYVAGAYVSTKSISTNFPTNTSTINSASTYYLVYTNANVPKENVLVSVKGTLTNYVVSKTVRASGSLSG